MVGNKEASRRKIGVADDADGPAQVAEPEPGPKKIGESSNGPDPGGLEPPGRSVSPRLVPARHEASPERALPPSVRYADMFRMYDTDNDNSIDHASMVAAFGQLGLLNGLNPKLLAQVLSLRDSEAAIRARCYPPHEFISHCERLSYWQARQAREHRIKVASKVPGIPRGAERAELLRRVYHRYAVSPGQGRLVSDADYNEPRMTSIQLQKVVSDMGLMQPNGPLSIVSVDLVFTKCKAPGTRKMGYPQFLRALAALAEESGADVWSAANTLGVKLRPSGPPPMDAVFGAGYRYEDDPGTYYADQELPVDEFGTVQQGLPKLPAPQGTSLPDRPPITKPRSKYFSQKNLDLTGAPPSDGVTTSLPNGLGLASLASKGRGPGGGMASPGPQGNGLSPLPRQAFGNATDNGESLIKEPLLGGGTMSAGRTLSGIASLPQGQAVLAAFKNDGGSDPLAGRPIRAFETPPSGEGDVLGDGVAAQLQKRLEAMERQMRAQAAALEEARATAAAAQLAAAAAAAGGKGDVGPLDELGRGSAASILERLAACEAGLAKEKAAGDRREKELAAAAAAAAQRDKELNDLKAAAAQRDQQLAEQRKQMEQLKALGTLAGVAAPAGKDGRDGKDGLAGEKGDGVDLDRLTALERRVAALEAKLKSVDMDAAAVRTAAEAAAQRAEELEAQVAAAAAAASAAAAAAAVAVTSTATAETAGEGDLKSTSGAEVNGAQRISYTGRNPAGDVSGAITPGGSSAASGGSPTAADDISRLAASLPAALAELDRRIKELQQNHPADEGAASAASDKKGGKVAAPSSSTAKAANSVAAAAAELAAATGAITSRNRQLGEQVKALEEQLKQLLANVGKLGEQQGSDAAAASSPGVAGVITAAGTSSTQKKPAAVGKAARDALLAGIRGDINAIQMALGEILKNAARRGRGGAAGAGAGASDAQLAALAAAAAEDRERLRELEDLVAALKKELAESGARLDEAKDDAAAARAAAEVAAERAEQLEVEVAAAAAAASAAAAAAAAAVASSVDDGVESPESAAPAAAGQGSMPADGGRGSNPRGGSEKAGSVGKKATGSGSGSGSAQVSGTSKGGQSGAPGAAGVAAGAASSAADGSSAADDISRLAASLPAALAELDRRIKELQQNHPADTAAVSAAPDKKGGKVAVPSSSTAKAANSVAAAAAELAAATGAITSRNRQLGEQVKALEEQLKQLLANVGKLGEQQVRANESFMQIASPVEQ
ncbi:hypothetical protein Vafri_1896 [Volvox africanus]|nr:hypothetical protein Vafri_1896 [Volvox africanus]